jgi:hypothetical protein
MDISLTPQQQQIALLVASVLAPFVVQIVKGNWGVSGKWALWLTYGIAALIGIGVYVATGGRFAFVTEDPIGFVFQLFQVIALVAAMATLIYKQWLADSGVLVTKRD